MDIRGKSFELFALVETRFKLAAMRSVNTLTLVRLSH